MTLPPDLLSRAVALKARMERQKREEGQIAKPAVKAVPRPNER